MIGLLLALAVGAAPPAAPPAQTTDEVEEVIVETPRPDKVFCVRYYKQSAWRAPRMTCKSWVEWRAIKAAQHDSRARTSAKQMARGLMGDSGLQEEAMAASVRPR